MYFALVFRERKNSNSVQVIGNKFPTKFIIFFFGWAAGSENVVSDWQEDFFPLFEKPLQFTMMLPFSKQNDYGDTIIEVTWNQIKEEKCRMKIGFCGLTPLFPIHAVELVQKTIIVSIVFLLLYQFCVWKCSFHRLFLLLFWSQRKEIVSSIDIILVQAMIYLCSKSMGQNTEKSIRKTSMDKLSSRDLFSFSIKVYS